MVIGDWISANPNLNLGAVMGPASGNLLVVDVDDRALVEPVRDHMPATRLEWTGKGGHLFFRAVNTEALGRLRYARIEIKRSGYVVVSPSRHRTGVSYDSNFAPIASLESDDVLALERLLKEMFPQQVASSVVSSSYRETVYGGTAGERDVLDVMAFGLQAGLRNNGFFWLVAKFAAARLPYKQTLENLELVYSRSDQRDFSWEEVELILARNYWRSFSLSHAEPAQNWAALAQARRSWTPEGAERRRTAVERCESMLEGLGLPPDITVAAAQVALRHANQGMRREVIVKAVARRKVSNHG